MTVSDMCAEGTTHPDGLGGECEECASDAWLTAALAADMTLASGTGPPVGAGLEAGLVVASITVLAVLFHSQVAARLASDPSACTHTHRFKPHARGHQRKCQRSLIVHARYV